MRYQVTATTTNDPIELLKAWPVLEKLFSVIYRKELWIELSGLGDLAELQTGINMPLIFTDGRIEIYDDYRE